MTTATVGPACAHVHNAKDRPSQDRPKRLLQMQEPDTELLAATHVNTQQPARLDDGPRTLTTGHEPGRNSKLLAVTSSARVGDQASTSTDHLAVGHSNSVEHPEPVTKSWQRPRGSAVIRTAPARCSAMSSAATTIRNDHVGRPLGFAVAHLPLPLRLAAAHTDRSATPQPSPSSPYSLVLSEYGPPPSRMWLG